MSTPPAIRLHLLAARAAPRVLIIRRGPTRVSHMALWHTDTDTVEHGSWFRGQLYRDRCDLSWDGRWLVYFALGPAREHWSWTAISRPPWVRAERFHPASDTWGGGGLWVGPDRLWLNGAGPARAGDPDPAALGLQIVADDPLIRRHRRLDYARMERDGWVRAGPLPDLPGRATGIGWPLDDPYGWRLRPRPDLPALRMFARGYLYSQGDCYDYALDGHAGLLDDRVSWAGYDGAGRLIVARGAAVERYTRADLARGAPSFRYDLGDLMPPPPPAPRPRPVEQPEPLATLGPDAQGRYHFLGEPERRRAAEGKAGQPIRGQADLRAIAPILREDRSWSFEKPQTYVVSEEGVFVLGGQLNEHVDTAGGRPVLAAGEAVLEEQADGTWLIAALNNRSYGYMPGPESWAAVERALRATGVAYPTEGFSEVHPLEGSWAEILAVLRS